MVRLVSKKLDWLQSLKQFSSMCHIMSYSDGSVLKQNHQSKTGYKYI